MLVKQPKPRDESMLGHVDPCSKYSDLFPERLELIGGHCIALYWTAGRGAPKNGG
jgi:hypothetical protein